MRSFFARSIGVAGASPFSPEAAMRIIERHSRLTPTRACLVVLDYLGLSSEELIEGMGVPSETLKR
jgi:hypothetical protein